MKPQTSKAKLNKKTNLSVRSSYKLKVFSLAVGAAAFTSCTGQVPGSLKFAQTADLFNSTVNVNTKLDILWVVDNSGSMDVSQETLRNGFATFAQKYMKPNWDIHSAVITTDTYLANPAFKNYLASTVSGSVNYDSPYINGTNTVYGTPSSTLEGRTAAWVNPAWAPNLFSEVSGKLIPTHGITENQQNPNYGPNYAKLLPMIHDGPTTTLCWENESLFLTSYSQCAIRDNQNGNTGPTHCANPAAGESGLSQCVNTVMNDTVHTMMPIISTIPPTGTPADSAWTNQLVDNFIVNLSTGSSGSGRERGLASIAQLMSDNEAPGSATAFFRPGALRVIVIVSDEDDQSLAYPNPVPSNFDVNTNYADSFCLPKTVDGYTYRVQAACPDPTHLVPLATYKSQFDSFFSTLDGTTGNPNYFVVPIVLSAGASIQQIHLERQAEALAAGVGYQVISDRGDRYIDFANLVGNGSVVMDFASTDYTPILGAIGQAIVAKKSVFTLTRAPGSADSVSVYVMHADGSSTQISTSNFTISGTTLVITNYDLLLGLSSTDQIAISYEPSSVQ